MTPPTTPAPLSWDDYKAFVAEHAPADRRFRTRRGDGDDARPPLFRGHRDQDWSPEATLERHLEGEIPLGAYLRSCHSAWSTLKSYGFTDLVFDPAADTRHRAARSRLPNLEFLAFLRHHGFPSPLLDWTESPYIAAFFALEEPPPADRHPCVFLYTPGAAPARATRPHVVLLGPFLDTARRHVAQQCWFTVALREGPRGEALLCSQREALAKLARPAPARGGAAKGGSLQKLLLHREDREKALAELAQMNITAFSLYGGVDALIKTITPRLF